MLIQWTTNTNDRNQPFGFGMSEKKRAQLVKQNVQKESWGTRH